MPTGVPSYQKVAPDGTVTNEFEGHITAEGLDLLAGNSSSPPTDRRIQWRREDDGALVAEAYGYAAPLGQRYGVLNLAADSEPDNALAILSLVANEGTAPFRGGIQASVGDGAAYLEQPFILRTDDLSNFVRTLGDYLGFVVAAGAAAITVNNGAWGSLAVVTGLSRPNRFVLTGVRGGGGGGGGRDDWIVTYNMGSGTTITFTARAAAGAGVPAGTVVTVDWLVVGHKGTA